jgi:hypothetical protein
MPQGAITAYLVQLIAKQVDDRGIVVWYDPETDLAKIEFDPRSVSGCAWRSP